MTKSDFRATKSLSAELMRIEDSLVNNQKELTKSFDNVKNIISGLSKQLKNVIEFRDSILNLTTAIKDNIDNLETDMLGLEGVDLFDFKTSPDDVILSLRKCSDYIGNLDSKIEENLKLIVKAKGNGQFNDEIQEANTVVHNLLDSSQEFVAEIGSSINSLLEEIRHFKVHSKDLLQHKIL